MTPLQEAVVQFVAEENAELKATIGRQAELMRKAGESWSQKEKILKVQIEEDIRLIDEWKRMYKELKADYDKLLLEKNALVCTIHSW